MPIANCVVAKSYLDKIDSSRDLIKKWADESKMSSEHMTINLIANYAQFGNSYAVMARLFLPTLWSAKAVSSLQTGLARALSFYFQVGIDDVHVISCRIDSGLVVENGQEQAW